jgi:hypothetical protein
VESEHSCPLHLKAAKPSKKRSPQAGAVSVQSVPLLQVNTEDSTIIDQEHVK